MSQNEADRVTTAQVAAAFVTAGIRPVGDIAAIAHVVSGQLRLTRATFALTPFEAEPASFLTKIVKESR